MHPHRTNPQELSTLLPIFSGGEFILKHGRGEGSEVYDGKIDTVTVPSILSRAICISSRQVYRKVIGCDADFSSVIKWERIEFPSGELTFDFDWFYQQPRRARLKLESTEDRCWLCSDADPINLALFRTMLMTMFLEEAKRKESLLKRLRRRVFVRSR